MQIDFHHGTVYVIARYAGFGHREAAVVAYCSQYVDDATNSGIIHFTNGAMYQRTSSAHKTLDYRNFRKLANRHVWIPFHFLPGNGGQRAGENPDGTFIDKLICRPDSPVTHDMLRECIRQRDNLHGLHRLGIAMHVYADTWSHQGFAGVSHQVNNIAALDRQGRPDPELQGRLKRFFGNIFNDATSSFVGGTLPLGHGAALSHPDRPYLKWSYRDHQGQLVKRDNPAQFSAAAHAMCKAMQRFRIGDADARTPGLPNEARDKINHLLQTLTAPDGDSRHRQWLARIKEGYFDFPPVTLDYRPKGVKSWKYEALQTRKAKDRQKDRFPYHPSFLGSDWKIFHDALLAHRYSVIRKILPRYGICAA